jgi:hypothetical protein
MLQQLQGACVALQPVHAHLASALIVRCQRLLNVDLEVDAGGAVQDAGDFALQARSVVGGEAQAVLQDVALQQRSGVLDWRNLDLVSPMLGWEDA